MINQLNGYFSAYNWDLSVLLHNMPRVNIKKDNAIISVPKLKVKKSTFIQSKMC